MLFDKNVCTLIVSNPDVKIISSQLTRGLIPGHRFTVLLLHFLLPANNTSPGRREISSATYIQWLTDHASPF
jgi:hypothetical protein